MADDPSAPHPYETLTPDVVQDALAQVGLHGDGRTVALSSYENRVYLLHLETPHQGCEAAVAKFYRPGRWSAAQIAEEHDFAHELAAAEVPVVAPWRFDGHSLHHHAGFAFCVSPRRGGRQAELDRPEVLEWIGRFLGRLHTVGAQRPFAHRPALDLHSFALEPREWLLAHEAIALDVRGSWQRRAQDAIDCIAGLAVFERLAGQKGLEDAGSMALLRLHGDCHPGNILWTPEGQSGHGPHFVDLDDARTGFAVQDLWMLLSGERAERQRQLGNLLDGYEQVREFDRRELALIEPLRTLRLIHYSAWLARRWRDPAFPRAFPWFGSSDYWQGQVRMLEEQIEAMAEPALVA